MRQTYVRLARASRLGLTELLTWHPRDIATLADILDDERRAANRIGG